MLSWDSTVGVLQRRILEAKKKEKEYERAHPPLDDATVKIPDPSIQLIKLLGFEGSNAQSTRIVYMIYRPPTSPSPSSKYIVHFHGVGQQLSDLTPVIEAIGKLSSNLGVLAVEYPGFGMAADYTASEKNIYEDSMRAIAFLQNNLKISNDQIILQGYSLGTGIASEMAYRGLGAKLVLIAPYLSVPEMASVFVPLLPTRLANWLIEDKIDTKRKAPCVYKPVLIFHGTADQVVPFKMGQKLKELFPCSQLITLESADHYVLKPPMLQQILAAVEQFIASDALEIECVKLPLPHRTNCNT